MLMLAKGKMYLVEKKKVEPLVGVAQAHIVDFAVSKMEEESQHQLWFIADNELLREQVLSGKLNARLAVKTT